eukprot:NODE_191_length_15469_cov_0.243071.p4 type:complete len:510 gc:universal NODE_191_length_15469_cov_0.243071:10902-12431(+)
MSKSTENMNTIGRMITKMDYVLANVFTSWNSVAYMSNMDSKLPTLPATKRIGPYILGKTLGIGSTGRVKLGMHYKTKSRVAIKIVPKFPNKKGKSDDSSYFKKLEREITIMKLIRHDNIMTLHDVYETKDELFLVMELIEGGELFDYLVKKGRLGEEEARLFFQQILLGLDFCHRHLICHRDLKPENLLLDSNRNIKIADFGMARFQMDGKMLETSCGSPHYASPEIIKGIKYDGPPSDIWSCGVILYALLSGSLPFDDDNIRRLLAKVKAGVYQIPEHISSSAQNLIERMLVIDPKKRITMDEIFYHPWFTNDGKQGIARTQIPREIQEVEPIQDIDPEIVKNLTYLGWEESELVKPLISEDKNIEKIFYNLLFERKKHPFYQIDSDDDANSSADGSSPRRRIELNSNHNSRESMLANIYKRRSDMHSSSPDISNLDLALDKKSKNTLNIQIPTTSEPNIVNPPSPFHRKHKDPSQYPATPIMNDTPTKVYNSEMFTFNKDLPTVLSH